MDSTRKSVPIEAFPAALHDLLRNEIDLDASGGIGSTDVRAMVVAYKAEKQRISFLKWLIAGGGVALVLMTASTFAVSFAAAELVKDVEPNNESVMIVRSSGAPLLSSQYTLPSGLSLVNSSNQRMQQQFGNHSRLLFGMHDMNLDSIQSQQLAELQETFPNVSFRHVMNLDRTMREETCRAYAQGAASEMNVRIGVGVHHISLDSVQEDCIGGRSLYGEHSVAWNLDCPTGSDSCHVFVLTEGLDMAERRRRLQNYGGYENLFNCDGCAGDILFPHGYAYPQHSPAPTTYITHGWANPFEGFGVEVGRDMDPVESGACPDCVGEPMSVICTHMRDVGRISQEEWDISQTSGTEMPQMVYRGYRYWADVVVEDLKALQGTQKEQTEMIWEYFVKSYLRQVAWFKQSPLGESSFTGAAMILSGYPVCWVLGLLHQVSPSLMAHVQAGVTRIIACTASTVYHASRLYGTPALLFSLLLVFSHRISSSMSVRKCGSE